MSENREFNEEEPLESGNNDEAISHEREQSAQLMGEILKISLLNGKDRYKNGLVKILRVIAAEGGLRPSVDGGIFKDKEDIERKTGINFDKEILYMKNPFVAHWEGAYSRNEARFALMLGLIEEEKTKKDSWLEDGRSDWVNRYFNGCDVRLPYAMSDEQNPEEVLEIFEEDCAYVRTLPLLDLEKEEIVRSLRIFFLESMYPIDVHKKDPASRDAMRREVLRLAQQPQSKDGARLRATGISMAMERYRQHVFEGFDHEEQEIQRREESRNINRIYQNEMEQQAAEYRLEMEFIRSLPLPKFEKDDWPRVLHSIASMGHLKTNEHSREIAHADILELIENLPKNRSEYFGDPWSVVTLLVQSYWHGQYNPDRIRHMVLENEIKKLPDSEALPMYGRPQGQFDLRKMFINGSKTKNAVVNSAQDPILMGRAYQRDMQLIRQFELYPKKERETEWAYNNWFLEGKLPIPAAKETSEDRMVFEEKMKQAVADAKIGNYVDAIAILQMFCDYWYKIAARN